LVIIDIWSLAIFGCSKVLSSAAMATQRMHSTEEHVVVVFSHVKLLGMLSFVYCTECALFCKSCVTPVRDFVTLKLIYLSSRYTPLMS
jgi:hypothetical protein